MATSGSWFDPWLSKVNAPVAGAKLLVYTANSADHGCTPKMFTAKKMVSGLTPGLIADNMTLVAVIGP